MANAHMFEAPFTGNLGHYSMYKRKGSDKWIIRAKGGPSAERLKSDPDLASCRRQMSTFGACSTTAKMIRGAMFDVEKLGDMNVQSGLLSTVSAIMKMDDTENEFKRKSIHFSKGVELLEGYNLNKEVTFDSVISSPIDFSIDRQEFMARIELPQLTPKQNFKNPWGLPLFRIKINFGIIRDMIFNGVVYQPVTKDIEQHTELYETDWASTKSIFPGHELALKFEDPVFDESCMLLLSIGIEFGSHGQRGIEGFKDACTAKILGLK